jgi:hypothetical protein
MVYKMPLIQLNLTDEQSEKLEHYAILKKLTGKQQAISELIDELEIEIRIKKDGSKVHEVRLKKASQ